MGDKFLSTLFKFRTKARSGARFFLRRDFVRLDFRFWATSRHRLKLSTQFLWRVDIIWHYLVTRWHYLTVSWHCPLGHPKIDIWFYSFTKMKLNAKNVNIVQCPLSTTKRQVALVTGEMLSTVRVPRAGVDKRPNFVFWFSCSVLCILYHIFVV